MCRWKCDTRRSKISLCPRGGALTYVFAGLRGRPGSRQLHLLSSWQRTGVNTAPPGCSSTSAAQVQSAGFTPPPAPTPKQSSTLSLLLSPPSNNLSSPALLDGGAQRILRELARGRDSLTGDVLPRLQDRREANFFARLDVPTLARRDPRSLLLLLPPHLPIGRLHDSLELGDPPRHLLELLDPQEQTPGHAVERLGVVDGVPRRDLAEERQLTERTGGEPLVHKSVVNVHVSDAEERDAEAGAKAQTAKDPRREEAVGAEREGRDAVGDGEDVVRLERTFTREVVRLVQQPDRSVPFLTILHGH